MNLIANNCVGAYIYQAMSKEFNNPFMWCRLYFPDFYKLYTKYDEIDLKNIHAELEDRDETHKNVLIVVDDKISLHFVHNIFDENHEDFITKHNNRHMKNIVKYTSDKFIERTGRTDEVPTFIFSFNLTNRKNEEFHVEKLLKSKSKYKLILLCHDFIKTRSKNDNVKIINLPNNVMSDAKFIADYVVKNNIVQYD